MHRPDQIEVLLVDDDEEDYLLTKGLLSRLEGPKHRIHWVSDYRSALQAAESRTYDVCLVDYQLGAQNGIELVRALIAAGHEMPVIVLTGHGHRELDVEAAQAGAADYLVKGESSPALLERTIRYAMRSHGDLQALREKEDTLQRLNAELEQRVQERTLELEETILELSEERRQVESFHGFGRALASGMDAEALGSMILRELSEFAGAEIGVLYTADGAEDRELHLLAARGLDPQELPRTLPANGEDEPIVRALAEGRQIKLSADGDGCLASLGASVVTSQEACVPLLQGTRKLGALVLARGAGSFSPTRLTAIEHLADQAAFAIADALSFRRTGWLANINRAVLDATVDAIHMVDLQGATLVANSAFRRLVAEVVGASADALDPHGEWLAERTTDPLGYRAAAEVIAADPDCERWDEYELAGSGRVLRRYTAPVWDATGSLIGRIFVIREVTGEREAERLKSELVATVSHELRTPLASVLGFAELLAARDLDPPTQTRYLHLIYNEAQRLTGLINDFLDLQRIEEGSFALTREPFDLAELLREQAEVFADQSERHALEVDLPDRALEVLGERERIGQVVTNLLANAIKYSPKGGTVKLTAKRTEGNVWIVVTDSGIGIPKDQQHQIFTKFFRVDSSDTREIGGTGLGLALCRELVEAHGGRIGLESVEGEGSTFWFELPVTAFPIRSGANGLVSVPARRLH